MSLPGSTPVSTTGQAPNPVILSLSKDLNSPIPRSESRAGKSGNDDYVIILMVLLVIPPFLKGDKGGLLNKYLYL